MRVIDIKKLNSSHSFKYKTNKQPLFFDYIAICFLSGKLEMGLRRKENQIKLDKPRPHTLNPSAAAAAPQPWGEGLLLPSPLLGRTADAEGFGMGSFKILLREISNCTTVFCPTNIYQL